MRLEGTPRAASRRCYPHNSERSTAQIPAHMASDSTVTTIKDVSGLSRGVTSSAETSIGGAVPRRARSPAPR